MSHWETVWTFRTRHFAVELQLTPEENYEYDGDDPDHETRDQLASGELVAFCSRVVVISNGHIVGRDLLGGSVYESGKEREFWTAHHASTADGRNTLAQKARNTVICHYFPDMVRLAIKDARETLHPAELQARR